jgi:deoxyribose-phosphate aldolase
MRTMVPVDRVGIEERAAALGKRSIKNEAKRQGIRLAASMIDLTTLEGKDTAGKVRALARKAAAPAASLPDLPPCAAVCVYPTFVPVAREALKGTGVQTAAVATGFPAGLTSLKVKLDETRETVEAGAQEIDMVIARDAFLMGDDARVAYEIEAVKDACGPAHLKVILETAELGSYDHVRYATTLAMHAGADFVKTSTGKASQGATPGVVLVMLEAVRDYVQETGRIVGVKAAGGVGTTKQALHQLVLVRETLGEQWLTPDRFRIGASSLLGDLLLQYAKTESGRYGRPGDFPKE